MLDRGMRELQGCSALVDACAAAQQRLEPHCQGAAPCLPRCWDALDLQQKDTQRGFLGMQGATASTIGGAIESHASRWHTTSVSASCRAAPGAPPGAPLGAPPGAPPLPCAALIAGPWSPGACCSHALSGARVDASSCQSTVSDNPPSSASSRPRAADSRCTAARASAGSSCGPSVCSMCCQPAG